MTVLKFMELLKKEKFTAEEIFAILAEISQIRIEKAQVADIQKFVSKLKRERKERRKLNPYEQAGD